MHKLHIVLHWSLQPFNLQSSVSRKVPGIVRILHGTNWCWKYPHLKFNPNLVHYFLLYLIRPLSKRFESHLHYSLPIRLWPLPLLSLVRTSHKFKVVHNVLGFPNCLVDNNVYPGIKMRNLSLLRRDLPTWPVKHQTHLHDPFEEKFRPLLRSLR